MKYSSQNIKLSFERPNYKTIGNTVRCSLSYKITGPSLVTANEVARGHNGELAVVDAGIMFNFGDLFGNEIISTGYARCHPDDHFDKSVGRKIARARAEQSAYTFARKLIRDYLEKVIDDLDMSVEMFDIKSSKIIDADKRFIEDLSENNTY